MVTVSVRVMVVVTVSLGICGDMTCSEHCAPREGL